MQRTLDAMKLALRVLTCLTERRTPDQTDVQQLYAAAAPHQRKLKLDELACEVILQAIHDRAKVRATLEGAESRADAAKAPK